MSTISYMYAHFCCLSTTEVHFLRFMTVFEQVQLNTTHSALSADNCFFGPMPSCDRNRRTLCVFDSSCASSMLMNKALS